MLRAGIIGAGRMAWGYDAGKWDDASTGFTIASCLNRHPAVQLEAIYDPVPQAREAFRAGYKGEGPVALFDNLDAFFAAELDLVAIASPSEHHFLHLNKCLDAGIERLWVEKPVTIALADFDAIEQRVAAMAVQPRICVNFVRRGLPEIQRLKEYIASSPDTPEAMAIEIRYSRKLAVNGVHLLDALGAVTGANNAPKKPDYVIPSASGNPSFGVTVSGIPVSLAGFDLPYHLIEMAVIDSRGRMLLTAGATRLTWEPSEPNPDHAGFSRMGASESVAGMSGDLQAAALNILGSLIDGSKPPIAPLQSARFSQGLMDVVLGTGRSEN
ncbi:MAG: Gfo/Idh/MocA family oxidoreductase [Marinomonas sp.]